MQGKYVFCAKTRGLAWHLRNQSRERKAATKLNWIIAAMTHTTSLMAQKWQVHYGQKLHCFFFLTTFFFLPFFLLLRSPLHVWFLFFFHSLVLCKTAKPATKHQLHLFTPFLWEFPSQHLITQIFLSKDLLWYNRCSTPKSINIIKLVEDQMARSCRRHFEDFFFP